MLILRMLLLILFFSVEVKGEEGTPPKTTLELIVPIDLQLRALRDNDILKAYNESSKAFKEASSLENFTAFIQRYPILSSHEHIVIKSQSKQGNEANVIVVLNPEEDAVEINYLLIQEDNHWKIWSMNIISQYNPTISALFKDPVSMRQPVEDFLQALSEKDIFKAYTSYTSKEFQETTSLEAFRTFIEKFPVLIQPNKLDFKTAPIIEKGTGKLVVDVNANNSITTIEYTLGIEEDRWKIWGMQILKQGVGDQVVPYSEEELQEEEKPLEPQKLDIGTQFPLPAQQHGSLQFFKFEIGSNIDLRGAIVEPQTQLKSPRGEIYVNLYVQNGKAGDKIEVRLQHVESQSELPEVSTTLQQDGNSVISFAFSPPAAGWPRGHYKLAAISSTNVRRTFNFTIE